MMDFNSMRMTHEQTDENNYRFKVGNDIIEVVTNFRSISFFDDLQYSVSAHYIKTPDNIPTNQNRTTVLTSKVYDYLRELYLKEIEKDLMKIASFSGSIKCELQKNYEGNRFHFYEGETAHDIFTIVCKAYTSTCASGDIYSVLMNLVQKHDGFLSTEIKEYLDF